MANQQDTKRERHTAQDKVMFVMSHVDAVENARVPLLSRWEESLNNYFVRAEIDVAPRNAGRSTANPLGRDSASGFSYAFGDSVLKDPESHQVVETLLAKLYAALFVEPGFIKADPVGVEDSASSDTMSKLLEYCLSLGSHPRVMYQWLKDGLIFGTGVVEAPWQYIEGLVTQNSVEIDQFTGNEFVERTEAVGVLYDDPVIRNLDIRHFYPDPGEALMSRMRGVAKKFETNRMAAENNPLWNEAAVKRAVRNGAKSLREDENDTGMDYIEEQEEFKTLPELHPMVGYEYWGEVPWSQPDGSQRRRVLTVINGELVRDRAWPLQSPRVPFYDLTIMPITGRFYGLSPLEVARYDQDFLDTLKMMIADAVIRGTHPPFIYDRDSRPDLAKLKRFNPRVPVGIDRIDGVKQLDYKPPIADAVGVYGFSKQHIREGTGALGAVQGHGLGSKRFSATEAAETFQQAFDRPEMLALLIERDSLPPLGLGLASLYQQFLDDPEELANRIGQRPEHVSLSQINMPFDLKFIGSRQTHNVGTFIGAMERFAASVGNIPMIAAQVPWTDWLSIYAEKLGLHQIRSKLGDPQIIRVNALLQELTGPNAQNNNGEIQSSPSGNRLPAQTGGTTVQ